jgi:hypothetical protein
MESAKREFDIGEVTKQLEAVHIDELFVYSCTDSEAAAHLRSIAEQHLDPGDAFTALERAASSSKYRAGILETAAAVAHAELKAAGADVGSRDEPYNIHKDPDVLCLDLIALGKEAEALGPEAFAEKLVNALMGIIQQRQVGSRQTGEG